MFHNAKSRRRASPYSCPSSLGASLWACSYREPWNAPTMTPPIARRSTERAGGDAMGMELHAAGTTEQTGQGIIHRSIEEQGHRVVAGGPVSEACLHRPGFVRPGQSRGLGDPRPRGRPRLRRHGLELHADQAGHRLRRQPE